ncbi:diguanylate cyclase domain-containing protein [Elioraea sp.]|uniref:diguanylate cyclase domain-containing protein n=1 Tax=Elioraea sp. TaxID=2185103 RepID=UPI003F72EC05
MAQGFLRSGIGRLMLALMLLAIAPAMLLLWHMAGQARDEHVRTASALQRQAAGLGATLAEALLAAADRMLARVAEEDSGWADHPGACIRRMRLLAEGHPFIRNAVLVARDGRAICSDTGAGAEAAPVGGPAIAEARRTGRPVLAPPVISRLDGTVALPIARGIAALRGVPGDHLPAAIVATLDLAWLAKVIATGAGVDRLARTVTIVDPDGAVLAHWPTEAPAAEAALIRTVLAAPAGAATLAGPGAADRIVGFAHARSMGLAVAVTVDRAAATRAGARHDALLLWLMVLAGAAGVGAALALARGLVAQPLLRLAEAAEAAHDGAPSRALPSQALFGELETLRRAVARMAGEIARRGTALDATAAELERTNHLLADLIERDPLTGLANRRAFDAALRAAWSRGLREAVPVGLLILDLDHFRQFNDRYGRLEGDACLMRIALLLESLHLRPYDLVARIGGEEFAVLLPDGDTPGVVAVGERIRAALHEMMLLHEGSPHGIVTASIGAASSVPFGIADPRVLLASADRALSAAKAGGRDRVVAEGLAAAA